MEPITHTVQPQGAHVRIPPAHETTKPIFIGLSEPAATNAAVVDDCFGRFGMNPNHLTQTKH